MTSVNRPTNVAQKEADVNQKLQLYGIYSGELAFGIRIDQCLSRCILLSTCIPLVGK